MNDTSSPTRAPSHADALPHDDATDEASPPVHARRHHRISHEEPASSEAVTRRGRSSVVLVFVRIWSRALRWSRGRSSLAIGLVALTAWFILFGLGALVDSKPFRLVNDPSLQQEVLAEAANAKTPGPESPMVRRARELSTSRVHAKKAVQSFILALCTYTPINLGLLCFWAGMAGGSASNSAYRRLQTLGRMPLEASGQSQDTEELVVTAQAPGDAGPIGTVAKDGSLNGQEAAPTLPASPAVSKSSGGGAQASDSKTSAARTAGPSAADVRAFYLGEHPVAAALRSFVVYLTLLAGFYLAAGDPFKNIDSSQYLRMAGIVSCLAFAIGYDPSRFTDIVNSLPKPGGVKV